ncbi:uncharacterized protein LOC129726436 [Wyeomyia smithii]|uniref:uncharacterized protein LOC129726436 n=1 Tax=Wyeomyia smithii TaxID=174621 RepID=UPI002467BA19|nr:uncharacterized protein LOC129726436 [Wyeomyia smithii]
MEKCKILVTRFKEVLRSLDDEADYFRPFQFALVIGGIYLKTNNVHLRRLFAFIRILIILMIVFVLDRIYMCVYEWKSEADTFGVVAFLTETVVIIIRAGATWYYREHLGQVRGYLSCMLNNRTDRVDGRNQSYRIIRSVSFWVLICFVVDCILIRVFGLYNTKMLATPDNLAGLGPHWKLFGDNFTNCMFLVISLLSVANLTVQNSVLMGFYQAMQDLINAYATLFSRVDEEIGLIFSEKAKELQDFEKDMLFWKLLKQELRATIISHNELLEQLSYVKRFLSITFSVMFYLHFLSLTCALFYCIYKGLSIDSIIEGSYILVSLAEMFWIFRLVDDLNKANKSVSLAIYNLDWHQRFKFVPAFQSDYRHVRAALLLGMITSQRTLGISCAGIFEISIEAFGQFILKMYNVLTFLLNMIL